MPFSSRRLFVATKNPGKMREFRRLFEHSDFRLETYETYEDVPEGESSYAENASLKAMALRRQLASAGIAGCVIGDDSGIEVAALSNRPGVLSARYGPAGISWSERRTLLRSELDAAGTSDRSARFICALHYIDETGSSLPLQNSVAGLISHADAGESGFSYDPAFWFPPAGKTFAEMSEDEKNRWSARGRAVADLLVRIGSHSLRAETRKS